MTKTGQNVLTSAYSLMGLIKSDGTESAATTVLTANAVPAINAVITEVTGFNERLTGDRITPTNIALLSDNITADDYILQNLIPVGVARYLSLRFDPEVAAYFKTQFFNLISELPRYNGATKSEITEVY